MDLLASALPATIFQVGSQSLVIVAGKRLTIETSPAGIEVLNATVPTGKVWSVNVRVAIQETDA